jgi:threonine/homoserine/homoserine lactone efflux protein
MFLKGLVLGFSIAAIVGPIGLLCIRRTLVSGRLSGFISGLGAALADAAYALIAALGLTAISGFLLNYQSILQLLGGLFLCYLGIQTFFSKPPKANQGALQTNLVNDFISTFFLTITNPLTILSFIAVFAGLGLAASSNDYFAGVMLVSGVFVGSTVWWLVLSIATGFFRKSLTHTGIIIVNKISGSIILGFGCWALWGFLKKVLM